MTEKQPWRKGKNWSVALYSGDEELVAYIATAIGCSKAEAVRSAIRSYAASLEKILPPH